MVHRVLRSRSIQMTRGTFPHPALSLARGRIKTEISGYSEARLPTYLILYCRLTTSGHISLPRPCSPSPQSQFSASDREHTLEVDRSPSRTACRTLPSTTPPMERYRRQARASIPPRLPSQ